MSPSDITLRNRANARHSTGPKTHDGKAAVAQNARRHGATAQPDPAIVAKWFAVILNTPDITPDMLVPGDEWQLRALALAQAEARLVAAEEALREFEAGDASLSTGSTLQRAKSYSLPTQTAELRSQASALKAKQLRLLKRYFREAIAQRRKALVAWTEAR